MIDLRLGDCLEVMDNMIKDGIKVDLIVTSPPYNLGHKNRNQGGILIKYNKYSDSLDYAEYEEWLITFLNKCYDLLSDKGKIYFNHKERHFKNYYFSPIKIMEQSKINTLQTIIWQRGGCTFNIGRYVNCYENIIVGYKSSKSYMRINKKNEKYFDLWKINPSKNDNHPATFPVELIERIIRGYSCEKDLLVLDPFMGSGTTGVACKNLNRNFIGIELDETYFNIAKERIENTVIQEELFDLEIEKGE